MYDDGGGGGGDEEVDWELLGIEMWQSLVGVWENAKMSLVARV